MSRQLVCFFAVAFVSLTLPRRALALLADEEKAALNRVYQVYQKAESIEAFEKSLRPWLDLQTQKFLQMQARPFKSQSLPKMTVVNSSRIKFKQGATTTTIDFISLRTELLAINGVEVEFQPSDDMETRWNKLMKVLKQQSRSARGPIDLFFPDAHASDDLDDRKDVVADNITVISMLVYGIQGSAEYQSLCADKPEGGSYATAKERCEKLASYVEARKTNPETKYKPNTLKSLSKLSDEVKKAKAKGNYTCSKAERDKEADLADDKFQALGGDVESNQHRHQGFLVGDDVISLSEHNKLNDTIRAKLQGIRKQMIRLQTNSQAENLCRKTVQICIGQLIGYVEEHTRTRSLRCYMERIIEEIGSDGSPIKATQPPIKPNQR